eukprot:2115408-Rhodomonas_salina.1
MCRRQRRQGNADLVGTPRLGPELHGEVFPDKGGVETGARVNDGPRRGRSDAGLLPRLHQLDDLAADWPHPVQPEDAWQSG